MIKADQEGSPNIPQERVLMQKLLADRFKIVSHREKKELSIYALTIAKGEVRNLPRILRPAQQPLGLRFLTGVNHWKELDDDRVRRLVAGEPHGTAGCRHDGTYRSLRLLLKSTPDGVDAFDQRAQRPPATRNRRRHLARFLLRFPATTGPEALQLTRGPADTVIVDAIERLSEN